jgi:peptidoglycan/LPS O-acetylase OafA/YrhL
MHRHGPAFPPLGPLPLARLDLFARAAQLFRSARLRTAGGWAYPVSVYHWVCVARARILCQVGLHRQLHPPNEITATTVRAVRPASHKLRP